jgi:hypothetical protein
MPALTITCEIEDSMVAISWVGWGELMAGGVEDVIYGEIWERILGVVFWAQP